MYTLMYTPRDSNKFFLTVVSILCFPAAEPLIDFGLQIFYKVHIYIFPMIYNTTTEVAQLCPTLCTSVDCCPPGSSVHGILQARLLEWVANSFSRRSSRPRDRAQVSHIAGRRFNLWATREAASTLMSSFSLLYLHSCLSSRSS